MVRFVHTADWQVGMTRRFLPADALARFASARVEVVRRIGAVAREQSCDFVLVCGDVFEHAQLTPQTVRRTLDALRAVEVPVYLLPGNHDHLGPMSLWSTPLLREELPANVQVLDRPGVHDIGGGVEIVAVPWHGKHPERDLVASVMGDVPPGPAPVGTVRVVAAHGAVDVLDQERRSVAAVAVSPLVEAVEQGRVHYVALGDRHSRTRVHDAVWYPGAPEPTAWREDDPGHVLVVEVGAAAEGPRREVRVSPHRVGTWTFAELHRRVDSDGDLDVLDAELGALPDKDRTVLRLGLRGTLGLAQHARLEEILARHADLLGAVHRPPQHTDLVLADDDDLAELELGGFLASAVEDIRALARTADVDEDEPGAAEDRAAAFAPGRADDGQSARDALTLLYRLARGAAR